LLQRYNAAPPYSHSSKSPARSASSPSRFSNEASFVAVSQDSASASRDFAHEFGVTFPILIDEAGYPVSNAYSLTSVPTFFLINPDGTVQVASEGFGKAELEAIADALADRRNITRSPVFRTDESIPAYKPG
jgi:hypothetical protein